jgi:predicted porin
MQIRFNLAYSFSASLLACAAAHAQPAAVQQLQNNQISRELQVPMSGLVAGTNAPELYRGENADVGPQRILRLSPRPTYFDILFDSQFFYSDNANYAQQPHAISSAIFVNTVQAAFAPPAVDLWSGRASAGVGLASQWYNYGDNRLENLDFNAETLFVSGKYTLGKWQVGLGANLTQLVNQENYDETYREFMPNLGVQRILPVNDKMFFSVGDLVDYHLTEVPSVFGSRTDINDRFDNIASVTFTWQATRHLILQPYYRFQYSYYQHDALATSDRNDYLQGLGLTAAYYFNPKISVRAFYNYNRRQTDDSFTPAYREMNGGIGATLDIKF